MLAASTPAFVPPEVSRGGGTAIPAWLCPLDTVLAIHRSRTSLGDGRTRARGSSLTSSPRGQRPRPQVSGGAARRAAGRRRLRRRSAAGSGRIPALRAPLPACGLSATLSNCRLWGRRGAAVGREEESWVPATAASGSPGRSRGERAHTGPPHSGPTRGDARGRCAGSGRSKDRTHAPVAGCALGRPEPYAPHPQPQAVARAPVPPPRAPRSRPLCPPPPAQLRSKPHVLR